MLKFTDPAVISLLMATKVLVENKSEAAMQGALIFYEDALLDDDFKVKRVWSYCPVAGEGWLAAEQGWFDAYLNPTFLAVCLMQHSCLRQ